MYKKKRSKSQTYRKRRRDSPGAVAHPTSKTLSKGDGITVLRKMNRIPVVARSMCRLPEKGMKQPRNRRARPSRMFVNTLCASPVRGGFQGH